MAKEINEELKNEQVNEEQVTAPAEKKTWKERRAEKKAERKENFDKFCEDHKKGVVVFKTGLAVLSGVLLKGAVDTVVKHFAGGSGSSDGDDNIITTYSIDEIDDSNN